MSATTSWWQAAFADLYLDIYEHRDDAAADSEVAGLVPRLRAAGGPVLDACCGGGRHLGALRAAGLEAHGFDYSGSLVPVAQARPGCAGRVVRGDVRRPPYAPGGFAAITVLFTAFGYFDEAANGGVLTALAALLRPAGWLVLDLPDPQRVRAALVAHSQRTTARGTVVDERRRLVGARVEKDVCARTVDGREQRYTESVRLYAPDEIADLAAAAGLAVVERWPSLRGAEHDDGRHVYWLRRDA